MDPSIFVLAQNMRQGDVIARHHHLGGRKKWRLVSPDNEGSTLRGYVEPRVIAARNWREGPRSTRALIVTVEHHLAAARAKIEYTDAPGTEPADQPVS